MTNELELNPDEIVEAVIIRGPVMSLRVKVAIAPGPQEESKKYFDAVIKGGELAPSQ